MRELHGGITEVVGSILRSYDHFFMVAPTLEYIELLAMPQQKALIPQIVSELYQQKTVSFLFIFQNCLYLNYET